MKPGHYLRKPKNKLEPTKKLSFLAKKILKGSEQLFGPMNTNKYFPLELIDRNFCFGITRYRIDLMSNLSIHTHFLHIYVGQFLKEDSQQLPGPHWTTYHFTYLTYLPSTQT